MNHASNFITNQKHKKEVVMKKFILVMVISFLMFSVCYLTKAQQVTLGFIGDKGTFLDFNNNAFAWAEKTFQAKLIAPQDITKTDLTKYAVLWWQDGDTDPTALLDKSTSSALMKYIESGGSLLLSSAAEKLATALGVESGNPRIYGPGADGNTAGVIIREDTLKHPVWEGFNRVAGEKIQVTSKGFPKSSDYYDKTFKEATTIGDTWENATMYDDRVGAFVEWTNNTGKGIIFGMGWRIPHWSDDNKDIKTLQKLTTNVINYLASKSLYFAVTPKGNISSTWGEIKEK
jgi:hypothetical protein